MIIHKGKDDSSELQNGNDYAVDSFRGTERRKTLRFAP